LVWHQVPERKKKKKDRKRVATQGRGELGGEFWGGESGGTVPFWDASKKAIPKICQRGDSMISKYQRGAAKDEGEANGPAWGTSRSRTGRTLGGGRGGGQGI